MEEGTGEIRYVEGISFDAKGDTISIEHLGYSDMLLAREMEEYIEDDDDVDFSPNAVVEPMDLMEMLAILGGM
jgi:hypothetical protein